MTRSALNAVEGGKRGDQRRARYFEGLGKLKLDVEGIMATGGRGWKGDDGEGSVSKETGSTEMEE